MRTKVLYKVPHYIITEELREWCYGTKVMVVCRSKNGGKASPRNNSPILPRLGIKPGGHDTPGTNNTPNTI